MPEAIGIAKLPDGVDVTAAGALGLAGTAALDTLDAAAPQAGETVLISGATARPGEETDFVRGLGAHRVADHTDDLPAQVRAASPGGVDVILHLAGDGSVLVDLLTDKGRIASTLGFGRDQHPAAIAVMADPSTTTLDRLAGDVAAGRVTIPVERTYPLADVPAAFGAFATGTRGKIAITIA